MLTRREFVASAAAAVPRREILNYNERMEYRKLGRTGAWLSAICLGGHWKRVGTSLGRPFKGAGYDQKDFTNVNESDFLKNRSDIISRCIEQGINYVDACAGPEILAYSKVLKGRRQKMYLGYSWHTRESRYTEFRNAKALLKGLDEGMKEAGLDYVDLWRISLPMDQITNLDELTMVENGAVEALELAKKQGKVRWTGVSSHNRVWLKSLIEQYPKQIEVVLFPYTAATRELPKDSIFDAVREQNTGVLGIKPFADNSLFAGDSSPNSPARDEDDRRARLALRNVLANPSITAPIPGLISIAQIDNAVKAIAERRQSDLTPVEKRELKKISESMWNHLRPDHAWLAGWAEV